MFISYNRLTVVFQGSVVNSAESLYDLRRNVMMVKKALPGVKIILSTWEISRGLVYEGVDDYVYSQDPGHLSPIKFTHPAFNNINRQIISTSNGLNAVTTDYAFKLRTDFTLQHAGFLEYIGKHFNEASFAERIMACMYYTLDTKGFERFAFHISDWVQFGRADALKALWSSPLMTEEEATYYEKHAHPKYCNFFEKQLRPKFAVEQFIWLHYAKTQGFIVPQRLVDIRKGVVRSYNEFIAKKLIILDPDQIGLLLPAHHSLAKKSVFQYLNCINYFDWLRLERAYSKIAIPNTLPLKGFRSRYVKKSIGHFLFALLTPFHSIAYRPQLRWCRLLLRRIFL